jgi:hypothetical protein
MQETRIRQGQPQVLRGSRGDTRQAARLPARLMLPLFSLSDRRTDFTRCTSISPVISPVVDLLLNGHVP